MHPDRFPYLEVIPVSKLVDVFHAWRKSSSLSARTFRTGTQVFVTAWVATGGSVDNLDELQIWKATGAGVLLYLLTAFSSGGDGEE